MLVYAPLEHIDARYTKHLDRDIIHYLGKNKIPYHYLHPLTIEGKDEIVNGSFLDADDTLYRQFRQFANFIEALRKGKIPKGSTFFTTDIWNVGVLAIPYLNFFSKYDIKLRGVLHAGSFTDTDFVREMERQYKGMEEIIFDIAEEIYVASEFIKQDVIKKRIVNKDKIIVTGLPIDELGLDLPETKKENIVIFNGRNVDEKQPYLFDMMSEMLPYEFVNTQKLNLNKREYYQLLNKSKVVVSFALQENFGYGILEAVKLGCVPVLPNRLVYPEFYPKENLYNTFEESVEMVVKAMEGNISVPEVNIPTNENIFNNWFNK